MMQRLTLLGVLGILLFSMGAAFLHPLEETTSPYAKLHLDYGFDVITPFGVDFRYHEIYSRRSPMTRALYDIVYRDVPVLYRYSHPPLHKICMSWVRWFSTETALHIWCATILLASGICLMTWLVIIRLHNKGSGPHWGWYLGIIALLLASYPSLFAFERGNTDVIVLGLITLTVISLITRQWAITGFLLSIAVLTKLYPLFVTSCLGGALMGSWLLTDQKKAYFRSCILPFVIGGLMGGLLVLLPYHKLYHYYLTQVVPGYGPQYVNTPQCVYAHSITVGFGMFGKLGWMAALGAACVGMTIQCLLWLRYQNKQALSLLITTFATAMLLSVYFAQISYDYNLIVGFPLILCLLGLSPLNRDILSNAGLLTLCLGLFTPRWVWQHPSLSVYLAAQCAGLAMILIAILRQSIKLYTHDHIA
jgi:hypothetical protein